MKYRLFNGHLIGEKLISSLFNNVCIFKCNGIMSNGKDTGSDRSFIIVDNKCIISQTPESDMIMRIRKFKNEARPTEIALSGGIFIDDVNILKRYFYKLLQSRYREFAIDMDGLYYICYEAVKEVSRFVTEMRGAYTLVKIRGMSDEIKSILAIMNEYELLSSVYHDDSWHRLEYQQVA